MPLPHIAAAAAVDWYIQSCTLILNALLITLTGLDPGETIYLFYAAAAELAQSINSDDYNIPRPMQGGKRINPCRLRRIPRSECIFDFG
jgi:hypothetical protein